MGDLVLTCEQVRAVDRLSVERFHMTGLVLMENAGRNAAAILRERYPRCARAWIACGTGNNGGDGCVIARHLHNAGWRTRVLIAGRAERMTPDTAANFAIVEAMDIPCRVCPDVDAQVRTVAEWSDSSTVIVDALLGTGFQGEVRPDTARLIDAINAARADGIVAVDVPSGLDCGTGRPSPIAVRAAMTVTFVAAKTGFSAPEARPFLGDVVVADIGVPVDLVHAVASGRWT